ncbi:mandelate racemase/muconate lactonizing enzyme family protein [Streptacidiphilus sp. PB12-B1b]|uniref:mandelate racemase/muconate lactonizing enzyme family protein n=1 Tax=Streptacidiphilus sp. PB12-B1b TaxID=2705012 RepID=UPI0015F96A24|nr:mandelate racemase/muconate lactonizing enzyme family protein [Streptacidiphilus sp. PB12-B1b]QMU76496.1 mandelate racemase/muconate lactonizing enzyme family protein [Streptacidiphilus sp. PB12-B1b]
MRITHVTTYILKQPTETAYLGNLEHGTAPQADRGYFVRPPWRSLYSARMETVLVAVTTDDGLEGWGEALAPVGPEVVAAIIDRMLGPWLIGRDPRAVRPLWDGMRDLMRERGHLVGHQADALAALDIALWDLTGRASGLSVAELLGGAYRKQIPAYVSGLPEPTDEGRARLAADWQARGAFAVKLAVGNGVDADLATYDAVAAAAPGLRIAVDAHWVYPLSEALELGRELDRRRALFFEAPMAPEDTEGHRDLASRITTPVAVGESLRNRYEFRDWLSRRALGLAQPDVARTGITEAVAIATLADAHNVPVACHHSVGLGVALAAGLHVSAATPNCPYFEFQHTPLPFAQRILRTPLTAGPTGFTLPEGPGLGIDVDRETVLTLAKESRS